MSMGEICIQVESHPGKATAHPMMPGDFACVQITQDYYQTAPSEATLRTHNAEEWGQSALAPAGLIKPFKM